MKKNYLKQNLLLILIVLTNVMFAQDTNKYNETNGNLQLKKLSNTQITNNSLGSKNVVNTLAPSISPSSQTICSGSAITNITASGPAIVNATTLDCLTGGAGTLITAANNGIFFDISNPSAAPLRISGFTIVTFAATATTGDSTVPFSVYKTTSATTAVGNYTTAGNWTNLGNFTTVLPTTAANSGYLLTLSLNDNGFTLAPGASFGIYIVCTNTATTGFKLGYRTGATTTTPITDGTLTVTHRARGDGLFVSAGTLRGFYGNVLYHTQTYGFWDRSNTTNLTGATNAGDAFSGTTPFPISGSLNNVTATQQTTTYTITSYDVNGAKDIQTATINVDPTPVSTVTQALNTLTADQAGASYQWFDCNNSNAPISGETNQSYTPIADGNYGVTVNLGSCPAVNSVCNNFTLGNKTFDFNNNFVLYPNPNNGSFTIKSEVDAQILLVNQLGQTIKKFEVASGIEQKMTIDNLNEGIYYLTSTTNNIKINKKLIISK